MSPSTIPNNASLLKDSLNLIDEAQDRAWIYLCVPAAGSEGVPKIHNMKIYPNAILNSTSLPKGTLKSIDETPVLALEPFCAWS